MQAMERRLVAGDGFAVSDVRGEGDGAWTPVEASDTVGVLFVRSGCFRRDESLLDVTSVYIDPPGREAREFHRQGSDDRWTAFRMSPAALGGGAVALPAGAVFSPPFLDLEHRRLLSLAYRSPEQITRDQIAALVWAVLDRLNLPRAIAGREAAVSPHHLSRIFAAETGQTISAYRNCLRARVALERVAAGERSLARIAADLGFADHAHLTRVVRRQAGAPPSNLRELLRFGA
jgi:AraC-like DNA-binding protein